MSDPHSVRPDLDHRDWPVPFNRREAFKKHGYLFHQAACPVHVREGYILAKELGVRGSGRPVPSGECAITSLALGDGWVFGATTGRRAHIFGYCTYPANEVVIDMIAFEEHASIRNSLVWMGGVGLYAGTSYPGKVDYPGGQVLQVDQPGMGDYTQEWGSPVFKATSLGVPVAGEGIACLIGDTQRKRLYGLSDRTGELFSVDLAARVIHRHGPIDPLSRFSPQLILGPDGAVYGCGTAGRMMRFDPQTGLLEYAGLTLPSLAGRGQYFKIGAWAMDPAGGLIYAGDEADGLLLAIDLRAASARVLGKPTAGPHVRALAVAPDGRVYGFAGLRDTIGHLFSYTPADGQLRDLGVLACGTEKRWYGFECDAAVAGPDGRIYLGESDRVSHLFVYFPPLCPK
jgi:hypothetical protein